MGPQFDIKLYLNNGGGGKEGKGEGWGVGEGGGGRGGHKEFQKDFPGSPGAFKAEQVFLQDVSVI